MKYARWSTVDEIKKVLTPVDINTDLKRSGIPMMYDDSHAYIQSQEAHSLVIGATGSGKTQVTILPMLRLALMAGESVVVHDPKGELYQTLGNKFKEEGYDVRVLDFANPSCGNCWNPLTLPYRLFKEGKKDEALDSIELVAYYLLETLGNKGNADPFWINSSISYFTGLVYYLFENAKEEEIHLNSVYSLLNEIDKEGKAFLDRISSESKSYIYLSGILNAPMATYGSIVSVFSQQLKLMISRESLSSMMSRSDFALDSIGNKKVIVFCTNGNKSIALRLVPLFVEQVVKAVEIYGEHKQLVNMLLDEFSYFLAIPDFSRKLDYSRSIRVRFIVLIHSCVDLINAYGKENYELLKMHFGNIIYLLANDTYTLEEISSLCGMQLIDEEKRIFEPLITLEELKIMKYFETIILLPRMLPIRTRLVPDYQIDWGYQVEKAEFLPREDSSYPIFKLEK